MTCVLFCFSCGVQATKPFMDASSSWAEQRIYNALAVAALEEVHHPMAAEMRSRYESIANNVHVPDVSDEKEWRVITDGHYNGPHFNMTFDTTTGSIIRLRGLDAETEWASPSSPLGDLTYKTFNDSDWLPFTYDYINGHSESGGFCKKGSNNFTVSQTWHPIVKNIYVGGGGDGATILVHMAMPMDACAKYGGSFQEAWLNVTVLSSTAIVLEMNLFNKIPTMIGESTMLTFAPAPELLKTKAWQLDKIGTSIDPENVIDGGNQFNHGVWNGGALGKAFFSMRKFESFCSLPFCFVF